MKIKVLTLISILLVSFNGYSASFDCTKAASKVEKTICDEGWLGKLDEELMYYYSKIKKTLADKDSNAFVNEQREWIKNRDLTCPKSYSVNGCLGDLYRARVNSLKIRYEEPLLPKTNELKKICSELASLSPESRVSYGSGKPVVDINNDGVNEITESCPEGTAHVPCVEYKNTNGTTLNINTINYEWKDYWTYGRKSFNKDGKNYTLHSYDDDFEKPAYVSYVTPENNEYVVCEFDNSESESFEPNANIKDAAEICNLFQNEDTDNIEFIALNEEPVMSRTEVRDLGMSETGIVRQGYVDYNNDGIKNYVGEFELASGAGRGCDFNFFDELMPDGKSLVSSPSRDLFREMQGDHCGGMNNKLFIYKGVVYYYLNTHEERNIAYIKNEEIKDVCTVEKAIVSKVKSVGIPNK